MNRRHFLLTSAATVTASAVAPSVFAQGATPISTPIASPVADALHVRLVDSIVIPNDLMVGETLVGGISGVDFDPASGTWYFLSDDRSDNQPARFYTGSVEFDDAGFQTVTLDQVVTLLQEDASPFPNAETGGTVPDPESIRKDPLGEVLWWTSEGSYELGLDPFVAVASPDGSRVNMLNVGERYAMQGPGEMGPRENLVFEGMAFSANGNTIWLGMEGPLFEDSDTVPGDAGTLNRLIEIDRDGMVQREVVFEIDALKLPDGARFFTSGITEILAVDDTSLLVVVRTTIQGADDVFRNYVRLWQVNVARATDVKDLASLKAAAFTPVERTMILDFNEAGLDPVDNLEGITWGPAFPNGNRSLVLCSDNNFNVDTQVTQFVLLEVQN